MFLGNTSTLTIEYWYIPLDIFRLLCIIITTILSLTCLLLIVLNKTCRTVPMMLVGNTCLAQLICVCTSFILLLFTFKNDWKQIQFEDSLCKFRGYINYSITVIQNSSYNLQSIHRYLIIVHPSLRFYRSFRFQLILIILLWIFAFLVILPLFYFDQIEYNIDNQICQVPIRLSFGMIYLTLLVYVVPNVFINVIYSKLIRHVHRMNERMKRICLLSRRKRELKMIKTIVTMNTILVILAIPSVIFLLISCFTTIPKWHFRLTFLFTDLCTTALIIVVLKTNESVRIAAVKTLKFVIGKADDCWTLIESNARKELVSKSSKLFIVVKTSLLLSIFHCKENKEMRWRSSKVTLLSKFSMGKEIVDFQDHLLSNFRW